MQRLCESVYLTIEFTCPLSLIPTMNIDILLRNHTYIAIIYVCTHVDRHTYTQQPAILNFSLHQ